MKKFAAGLLACSLAAFVGCETKSGPGGPGTTKTGTGTVVTTTRTTDPVTGTTRTTTETEPGTRTVTTDRTQTFTISTPTLTTNLKPGEKEEVDISVSRGSNFNQKVTLKFDTPKGLTITPASPTIEAGQKSVKVHVEAAQGTPAASHDINVTATPETGEATTAKLKVAVK